MAKRGPSVKYDTFWVNVWQKSGMSSKDIGDKLHVTGASVRNWFSGRYTPDERSLCLLCDLFGVDRETGRSEFVKAHKEYWANREKNPNVKPTKTITKTPEVVTTEDVSEVTDTVTESDNTFDDVLRILYKKVDYTTFMKVSEILKG